MKELFIDKKKKMNVQNIRESRGKRKRTLIYSLTNRGFLSELNNLLLGILYSDQMRMDFKLNTSTWSSKFRSGWTDYFYPFCDEITKPKFFIPHKYSNYSTIGNRDLPVYYLSKIVNPRRYLIQDVWQKMRNDDFVNTHFLCTSSDKYNGILSAKRKTLYDNVILKQNVVDYLKENEIVNSIKPFAGIHIRRGDKVLGGTKEANAIRIAEYIELIEKNDRNIENLFVATDDYSCIEDISNTFKQFNIFTFCEPNKKGYKNITFIKSNSNEKKKEIFSLFLDLYHLCESDIFVGTYSSNIGRFVALYRNLKQSFSVDRNWNPF